MTVAEIPASLLCAQDCPYHRHCGKMVRQDNPKCIEKIGDVIEGVDNLEVASPNKVHAKSGVLRLATIESGKVSESY